MRKSLLILSTLFIFLACASTKTKKEDPYNEKKMRPVDRTGVQKFFGTNKYDVLDECTVFVKNLVGKMKVKKGSFIYRRGTDVAGFRIYYDTTAYALQMAQEARETCIAAIDKYCADFDNKALDRNMNARKSRRIYGEAGVYIDYGVAIDMMNYNAKPDASFGYVFDKKNPYFVIHLDKAKNLKLLGKSTSEYGNTETIIVNFYFTRKQAQALKAFISNENVNALMANYDFKEIEADAKNDSEEYFEADDYVSEDKKAKKKKENKKEEDSDVDYTENDDYTEIKK